MATTPTRGVTRQQIEEAIEQLLGAGEDPTTTKIRRILGTGSYTTIGNVLEQWWEQLAREKPPPQVPDDVKKLFQRAWLAAINAAATAHENERTGFMAARSGLEQANTELLAEVRRLETAFKDQFDTSEDLQQELSQQTGRIGELEMAIARAEAQHAAQEREIERIAKDNAQAVDRLAQLSERAAAAETALTQTR